MPPQKAGNWRLWAKMILGGTALAVGGPWLTQRMMISEEDALAKYTPDERKKILEKKAEKDREFQKFVDKLKEQTKSSDNIWTVEANERKAKQAQLRKEAEEKRQTAAEALEAQKEQMRREAGLAR